jgi:ATP-dependent Lhr-like helicase
VRNYDPPMMSGVTATGETVWMGESNEDTPAPRMITRLRFFQRGRGALWVGNDEAPKISADAELVLQLLSRSGAVFFAEIQAETKLGLFALREALRELVAAGMVTNDSFDALREVLRLRPLPASPPERAEEASRWLPTGFQPSADRPVVQRRVNIRRLPKWRRPDKGPGTVSSWSGRWSLVRTRGTLGEALDEESRAGGIAQQWLARYGIVTRDWWRRERPPVSWRSVYRELKRLEMRGEVRRGYFVRGLGGAQFALPEAVEQLRWTADQSVPFVVMAASDPANPYSLALEGVTREALSRPRGAGALLVTRSGRIAMAVEGRGERIAIAGELTEHDVTEAARALASHLLARGRGERRRRDVKVRSIDGRSAAASQHVGAFLEAGYMRSGTLLRFLAPV